MRLFYYKSRHGNVGDDLNAILWPKVFSPSFFDDESDRLFLGIGSIFDDRAEILNPIRPIVFGSGLRSRRKAPADPGRFDIRFVRGPRSAHILKRIGVKYISDPAIIAPTYLPPKPQEKTDRLGYVPYFMTPDSLNRQIAEAIGAKMIPPTLSPQDFIDEIASCDRILSEAMHGAILADAYRIPWAGCRLMSGLSEGRTSLFKWADWMESLGIRAGLQGSIPEMAFYAPRRLRRILNGYAIDRAVLTTRKIVQEDHWYLSDSGALRVAQEKIHDEVERLRQDYPAG